MPVAAASCCTAELAVASVALACSPALLLLHQVKMRDVCALVSGVLTANSLARGMSEGMPAVLQKHLTAMEQQAQQQLAPAGPGDASREQLQGQVRRLCRQHCCCCCWW